MLGIEVICTLTYDDKIQGKFKRKEAKNAYAIIIKES